MKILDILHEAKFRKPISMYHGTSDKFLNSILKNGISPNPTNKVWDSDENTSATSASRKSLKGSYWTSNLMTAIASAGASARKFGGNALMIIADIAEQSSYADEDSINGTLGRVFAKALRKFHLSADNIIQSAPFYYSNKDGIQDKIINYYTNIAHEELSGSNKHNIDKQLWKRAFNSYMMRVLAHAKKNGEYDYYKTYNDLSAIPDIPSVNEAEDDWLNVREAITRQYKSSVYKDDLEFNHTLRLNYPVTYRGSNKITGIVGDPPRTTKHGEPDTEVYKTPRILYYGKVTDDYLHQYRQRVGKFPGLVDRNGNMIIQPDKE